MTERLIVTVNEGFKDEHPVVQAGLYSESIQEIDNFVRRVAAFNERFSTNVKVDVLPVEKGDAQCERPHAKFYIYFPSHEVQDKFWLE